MLNAIRQDLKAVFDRDPAATSRLEVILTYAGFHALMAYRVAHWLKSYGIPLSTPRHFPSCSLADRDRNPSLSHASAPGSSLITAWGWSSGKPLKSGIT